jgi:hypothetical protein
MKRSFGSGAAVVLGVAVVSGLIVPAAEPPAGDSEKSLQAIVRTLKDKKVDVDKQIAACAALRKLGPNAKSALPGLLVALNDTRSFPCQVTLTDRVPPPRPATPDQPAPPPVTVVPTNIGSALEELNRAVPKGPVITPGGPTKGPFGMEDRGLSLRRAALDVIAGLGPDAAEAVPALVTAIKGFADDTYQDNVGQEQRFLEKLVSTIGQFGPQAKDAVAPLAEVLGGTLQGKKEKRPCGFTARMKALNALAEIDADSPGYVAALIKVLNAAKGTTEAEKKGSLGLELAVVRQLGEVQAPALLPDVAKALAAAKSARDPALQRAAELAAERIERSQRKRD